VVESLLPLGEETGDAEHAGVASAGIEEQARA
jgi:hypothetical protein